MPSAGRLPNCICASPAAAEGTDAQSHQYDLQAIGLLTLSSVAVGMAVVPYWSDWLQIADEPEKADYIVVLDGDGHRLLKAIELFKRGFAPTILLSNACQRPTSRLDNLAVELGYPEIKPHEFRSKVLQHFGVLPQAIAEFGNGHISTLEEAEALKQFMGARAIRAILVTSPSHARCAKLTFKSVMPLAYFVVVCPPEGRIDPNWWRHQQSALTTLNETAKLFYFWLGGAFRAAAGDPRSAEDDLFTSAIAKVIDGSPPGIPPR